MSLSTISKGSEFSRQGAPPQDARQAADFARELLTTLPPFVPHPLVRGGHAQTVFANVFCGRLYPYRAENHHVLLEDGDTVVVHDDVPDSWQTGGNVVVLLHGLSGCHQSPYVNRAAGKLNAAGFRTFRMDFRGSGAGVGLSTRPYHAGLEDDLRQVVEFVAQLCPDSPVSLVGYSMGGNLVLRRLANRDATTRPTIASAVVVCPAIDLPESQVEMGRFLTAFYDRYFTKRLVEQLEQYTPHLEVPGGARPRPRTLKEFDEAITAPVWGFENADRYYDEASTASRLQEIDVPTLVIASQDDPVVPVRSFERVVTGDHVNLLVTPSGGHLGFVSRKPVGEDRDRRWMDWRVVDWLAAHSPPHGV